MKVVNNELISIDASDIIKGIFNVPNNIKAIGPFVFANNDNLKIINIPDSVESIGANAFTACKNLKKVKLPSGLKKIETALFSKCENLRSIVLPDNVTHIGKTAFYNCKNLKKIELANNLEYIDDFAFCRCISLVDITWPIKLKKIGEGVFLGCKSLIKMLIPDSTYEIGESCFRECENLRIINLPMNLKRIKNYSFYNCFKLNKITIPNNLEVIGDYAFGNCRNLCHIELDSNLRQIGKNSFINTGLYSITIPHLVQLVDCNSFSSNYPLFKIIINSDYCKIVGESKTLELKSSLYCFSDINTYEYNDVIIDEEQFNLVKDDSKFRIFRKRELFDCIYVKLKDNYHIYNLTREHLDIFYIKNTNFKEIIDYILDHLDNEKFNYQISIDIFDSLFPNTRFINLPSMKIFFSLNKELARSYNYKIIREMLNLEILKKSEEYIINIVSLFGLFEKDKYVYNRLNIMKKLFDFNLVFDEDNKKKLKSIDDSFFDSYKEDIFILNNQQIPIEYASYLSLKMTKEDMKRVKKIDGNYGKKINDFVKLNYSLSEERRYVIKKDIDINSILDDIFLSCVNNQITYNILFNLFNNKLFKYNERVLKLFIDNFNLILKNEELQKKLNVIISKYNDYEQFSLLRGYNNFNIYDILYYIENQNANFDNIKHGNYEFALLTTHAGVKSQVIFEKYQALYEKIKERQLSYIPRVVQKETISINNEKYNICMEILRKDDPLSLLMGETNYTDCCQKLNSMGSSCVEHIALDGRVFCVFLIDNKGNKLLLSESWMWRCGNLICFDNIEGTNFCKTLINKDDIIIYAYKKMSLEILDICRKHNDKVDVIAVGENHNCIDLEKYFKFCYENPTFPKNYLGYTDSDKLYFIIGNKNLIDSKVEEKFIYLDERVVENKTFNNITTKNVSDIVKIGNLDMENIVYTKDLSKYYNLDLEELNICLGMDWYFIYSFANNSLIIHDFKYVKPLFSEDNEQINEIKNYLRLLCTLKSSVVISSLNKVDLIKIIYLLDNEMEYDIVCSSNNIKVNINELNSDYNFVYNLNIYNKNKIFNYTNKFDKIM